MADSLSKPDLGRVAVIGGAGFLGSHIVDAVYSSCKAEIYVISRSASKYHYQHLDVKYIDADLVKTNDGVLEIESVFKQNKIDVVFHAATPPSMTAKDEQFRDVNINGTKNVILAAQNSGVKALIYTSSMAVVRPSFQAGAENSDESWPLFIGKDQEDSYAATKVWLVKILPGIY
jgi:sterol-4alpha-carboxylate 3-dehydrogenase (decarboxylating)